MRQAFLDDKLPVPILMVENAFMANETKSSWGPNRGVGQLSYNSSAERSYHRPLVCSLDSSVLPMDPTQREVQVRGASGPSRGMPSSSEAEGPNVPTKTETSRKWGNKQDIDELNRDIEECLRIEGVASPEIFFNEWVHFGSSLSARIDASPGI